MIHLLPLEVQSCLRSGIATPSITQCVEELVLNSVDAGATCVAVRVDFPHFKIQVVDNGRGLSEDELSLVGQRYATSKCHKLADLEHLEFFGYRGEALASISDIARVLEIVSRAKESDVTMSKLFQGGKSKVFEASRKRPSVGTTVTVHGVFYNMPVRRKMTSHTLDYERVCRRIEGLALIHPDISFSLRDDSTGTKSIQTHIAPSTVSTFRFLFGQSKAKCIKQVTHQEAVFSISGYIGTEGHPNKSLQFIYVNNRLVLKTRLHKAVNHLLRKSLIAHYRPRLGDKKSSADSTAVLDLSNSPGRAADLYGIFVLNVKCPLREYDICLEPSKTLVEFRDWSVVLGCVQKLVDQFLTQENLTMKQDKENLESSPCDLLTLEDGSSQEDEEVSPGDKDRMDTNPTSRLSQKYGRGISAASCSSTLQSLTVRRPLRKQKNNIRTSAEIVSQDSNSSSPEVTRSPSGVTSPVCINSSSNVSSPVQIAISPTSMTVEVATSPLTETSTSNQPRKVQEALEAMSSNVDYIESVKEYPGRECKTKDEKTFKSSIQESSIDLDNIVDEANITEQIEKQSYDLNNQRLGGNANHVEKIPQMSSRAKRLPLEPVPDFKEISSKASDCDKVTTELESEEVIVRCSPVMDGPDTSSSEFQSLSEISNDECLPHLDPRQDINDTPKTISSHPVFEANASVPQKRSSHDKAVCVSNFGQTKQNQTLVSDHGEKQSSTSEESNPVCKVQDITNKTGRSPAVVIEEVKLEYAVPKASIKNVPIKCCSFEKDNEDEQSKDSTVTLEACLRKSDSNSANASDARPQIDVVNDNQFTTPNIDSLTYSYHQKLKKPILDLSDTGLDTPSFDSDGESDKSYSCGLIEQDEKLSAKITMTGIAVKESSPKPSEVCGMTSRDKAHHFKTSHSFKPENSQRKDHLVVSTLLSPSSKRRALITSSLQKFRRSFRAEPDGDRAVKHSISELLKGKDVEATRRFHPRSTGRQGTSSHFTTTSPVMLKRRFPPVDMMLGNNSSDERSIEHFLKKRQMSIPNKKKESAEPVSDLLNSTEMKNKTCSPPTESKRISTVQAKGTLDVHVSTEDKGRNGEQQGRVTVTHKPNLKRLRQMHMASEMKLASEATVKTCAQTMRQTTTPRGPTACENPMQERKMGEKAAPLTKRFMTSDSFLQTFQEVFPTGSIKATNLATVQESSNEIKMPQVHHIEQSPQAVRKKLIATYPQTGPDTSTDLNLPQAAFDIQMPCSLFVNKQAETNDKSDEITPATAVARVCGLTSHTEQNGQKKSPEFREMHINSKIQSELEELAKDVDNQTKEDNFQTQDESQSKTHEQHKEPHRQTDPTFDDSVKEHLFQRLGTDEDMFFSESSEEISQGLPRVDQFPPSVILCDTKTFKLRRAQLTSSPTLHSGSSVPSSWTVDNSAIACNDPTEIRDIGCNIIHDEDDSSALERETTEVSILRSESRSVETYTCPFLLPYSQDVEEITANIQENTEVGDKSETGRKCDTGFDPLLDVQSPANLIEEGFMETKSFLLNQSQPAMEVHQACNQTLTEVRQVECQHQVGNETSPTNDATASEMNQLENLQEAEGDMSKNDNADSNPAKSDNNWTVQSIQKLKNQEDLLQINETQHDENLEQVSDTDHCNTEKAQSFQEGDDADPEPTVHDKSWMVQYDHKLKRKVYINLKTGNCSYENPAMRKEAPWGDGITEEESRSDGKAVIIQTGRKKSYLHRVHSQCAEPFLAMLSKPDSLVDVSSGTLSPSSHSALIHMVDEHMDQQGGDIASKWRGDCPSKQTADEGLTVDELFANWTNPMFATVESGILDAQRTNIPHSSIRAQSTIHPYKFTKAMFQDIKVLGQVDNKFIACMVNTNDKNTSAEPNLILLIDQHAAHERVRLEQLTADVFEDQSNDKEDDDSTVERQPLMKSSSVIPPISMTFSRKQLRLLGAFGSKLWRLGISYRILDEDEDNKMEEGRIEITRLPACLMEREAAELKRGRQSVAIPMVETLLMEHLELLQQTSGASAILPKTITRVLNSQACHGAIKFGDDLSHHECLSLIGQLSNCDLPFQCAHGRPSLVPLFDMKLLASKLQDEVIDCKPRLKRLRAASS